MNTATSATTSFGAVHDRTYATPTGSIMVSGDDRELGATSPGFQAPGPGDRLVLPITGATVDPVHFLPASMDQPRPLTSSKHLRLGALLRDARIAAGMRQTRLAELLGRKQAFVSKYEGGSRGLDAVDFLAILEFTGCDVNQVIEALKMVEEG